MPGACLARQSPERMAIDEALVAGEPLRDIAGPVPYRVDKNHIATSVVTAEERREEGLGESLLDEMRFGESGESYQGEWRMVNAAAAYEST